MSRTRPILIRVLIGPQGDQWLAQALEYDIATQAPSEAQVIKSFMRILQARLRMDLERGRQPFDGLPPAPEHFISAWERLYGQHQASLEPTDVTLPAYVIKAVTENPADLTH